ncbi:MAG: VWA domain-containing protein [Clostridia bacterium]|nr:VWA domain-containing protein [Clostridia bacterium]
MKTNNITELVFILDRSGSMGGLESDTTGGFNAMIEKQRKEDGKCFVSTILFDHCVEILHDRVKLKDVRKMTEEDYYVRGATALIDAIGTTIDHIKTIHKYARHEDVPEHTVFVITTDGMENASRKYSSNKVKKMIEKQEKKGWEFLFIGANIDSVETARHIGIREDRAVNYHADKQGTSILYETVNAAVRNVRNNAAVPQDWSKAIEEDYNNRKE